MVEFKKRAGYSIEFQDELEILSQYVKSIESLFIDRDSLEGNGMFNIKFQSPVNPSIEQLLMVYIEQEKPLKFELNINNDKGVIIQKWIIEAWIYQLGMTNYDTDAIGNVILNVEFFQAKIKLDF